MEFIQNLFKSWFAASVPVAATGPNTLAELLQQFDAPVKHNSNEHVVRDYTIKETMAALELDMLRMDPTVFYAGRHRWQDDQGQWHHSHVPCACRPEVVYCCHGKS